MLTVRSGSSLVEVLLALVLITLTASWALQAAAATERAVGAAASRRDAMQRATLALADLQALPCDTTAASRVTHEPRWRVTAVRMPDADDVHDYSLVATRRADTLAVSRHRWCSR